MYVQCKSHYNKSIGMLQNKSPRINPINKQNQKQTISMNEFSVSYHYFKKVAIV